jgi:DNA-directed RNA polymerase subunit beta
VKNGKLTSDVKYLRADEEQVSVLAPADSELDASGKLVGTIVLARKESDFVLVEATDVQFMDVSPRQVVGVSAALIPFLEHDDANRALMGSNMQRQAVPAHLDGPAGRRHGHGSPRAEVLGMVVVAEQSGTVTYCDASRILVDEKEYRLRKFVGLNERTASTSSPASSTARRSRRARSSPTAAARARASSPSARTCWSPS